MKPLRVYLAASFSTRREAIIRASELTSLGIDVTSSWTDSVLADDPLDDPELCASAALACHRDIEHSDVLVFNALPGISWGKCVELGIAIGTTKRIVILGPMPSVFAHHPFVAARFDTWPALVEWLREQLRA